MVTLYIEIVKTRNLSQYLKNLPAHLQSTVERPGNGDALGLGLARRDGSLQLVQVTVLLQLLYQALERQTSQ